MGCKLWGLHRLDLHVAGCLAFAKSKRAAADFHALERADAMAFESFNADSGRSGGSEFVSESASEEKWADGVRKEYKALTLSRLVQGRYAHMASVLDAHFSGDQGQGVAERSRSMSVSKVDCKTPKDKVCVLEVVSSSPLANQDRSEVLWPFPLPFSSPCHLHFAPSPCYRCVTTCAVSLSCVNPPFEGLLGGLVTLRRDDVSLREQHPAHHRSLPCYTTAPPSAIRIGRRCHLRRGRLSRKRVCAV